MLSRSEGDMLECTTELYVTEPTNVLCVSRIFGKYRRSLENESENARLNYQLEGGLEGRLTTRSPILIYES